MPLLDKSEAMRKYVPPQKPGSGDAGKYDRIDHESIQGRVEFYQEDDRTQHNDQAINDAKYYYMWSKMRGIFKGEIR